MTMIVLMMMMMMMMMMRGGRMTRRRTNMCDSVLFFVEIGYLTWYDVYLPNIINPWGCIEPVIIPSSPFPFDLLMRRACSDFFKAIRIQEVFIDIQTKRLITWTMKEKTVRLLKKSCREMASIMPYLLPMIPAQLISCLAHQEPN